MASRQNKMNPGNASKAMMRKIAVLMTVVMGLMLDTSDATDTSSVVKVFVTSDAPSFYQPWKTKGTGSGTGSGAIISGKRILTNAHVVADQTFIQVKKNNGPKKYTAKLIAIQHESDLALLTVEDLEFFEDMTPLKLGGLPKLQDTVNVLGYPTGGDKLSITEGVVSRLEVTQYTHGWRFLLSVQIDAAINPGNSGGPVIMNDSLVGIAMQVSESAENVGYMIPVPIIKHFFKDLEDDNIGGIPAMGISVNATENESMRAHYKIQNVDGGVLVTNVPPFSPAEGELEVEDVILSIDDTDIGTDGTFVFRGTERLYMTQLISDKQMGDTVKIKIMRDGKAITRTLTFTSHAPLVKPLKHFKKPSYYIYGGLIFTVLAADYLIEWGDDAPAHLMDYYNGDQISANNRHEEKVVLIEVLPDQLNVGYHDIKNNIVTAVNGVEITSFKQFVGALQRTRAKESRTVITTEQDYIIVLDNKGLKKADAGILKRYSISTQYSDDVAGWLTE